MGAMWATKRIWLPFVAAAVCLTGTAWSGPLATYVLVIAAFGFVIDGVTIMWPRGDKLTQHRQ